jgi:flagellar motor component MotA
LRKHAPSIDLANKAVHELMMKTRSNAHTNTLLASVISITLSGCADHGAPSFSLAGAYFPAWMVCALIGIVATIGARVGFVISGLATVLPYQLFVCTSIGVSVALLAWLLWFGQ